MPITNIQYNPKMLQLVQVEKLSQKMCEINCDITGLPASDMLYFVQKYEEPFKADPVEIFVRLSPHLVEPHGGKSGYADRVEAQLADYKSIESINVLFNLTIECPNWELRIGF
jgi:hypothetical protein